MEKQQFHFAGYGYIQKKATNIGNSTHVYVPKKWAGKKVVAILLEEIE